ncbi:FAD-dependent oxidoreductase [Naumannella halotolerans]|uniref:2-polyprenyl-6-methoxyphenol hydroxylase-like FAD-dependent oxidoreductase n=1 Tax=Naumannella halotolerans TaxID=993414 RepID=A0A4R7J586_9ACTN|nr:FAD-dependent oxidoreductase [Naumannella halotolerans]TDT32502.1 2-polyprenyl-6-methoxyphenol hydroxylase-like FAD-dependent oxidoreductase [Naumannella halotolerans]
MTDDPGPDEPQPDEPQPEEPTAPRCIVVGGGPGGMLAAYLLARAGIAVTLLESHQDFDRDFRGDSLHPWTLELMDRLGLAEDLLALPHFKATRFRMFTPAGTVITTDYTKLDSRFPFVALMPQVRFLDFLAGRAAALPEFTVITGARVRKLIFDGDRVAGVAWRDADGPRELRADLVIAADGRFSKLRALSELPVDDLGATTDLLWFRMPRRPDDPAEADVDLYFGRDAYAGLLGGVQDWQIGVTVPKGGYAAARSAGVAPIKQFLAAHLGWLGDRIELLTGFDQITLLSVELKRVRTWHREGLLLIGDAAHVISPVGGNGILMALQDAVVAANLLVPALRRTERPGAEVMSAIQSAREPAIVQVQQAQVRTEQRAADARERNRPLIPGRLLKVITALPGARRRSAARNGYGPYPPALAADLFGADHR